jgi:hypothetical protein
MKKRLATLLAALMVSLGLTAVASLTVAPVANAAGECGSGYSHLKSYPVYKGSLRTSTIEVYWNSTKKYNCVINRAAGGTVGATIYRGVYVKRSGQSTPNCNGTDIRCDVGKFKYYAGPVYVYAPSSCITVYAWNDASTKFGTGLGARLLSNVHCG